MAVPTSTIDIATAATTTDVFFTTLLLVYFSGALPPNILTKSSRQDAVVAGQTFWSQPRQADTVGSPTKEGALLKPHTINTRVPISPNDPQIYRIMFPFFASIFVSRPPYAPSSKRHATWTQMAATPFITGCFEMETKIKTSAAIGLWRIFAKTHREYSPSDEEVKELFDSAADARKRSAKCAIAHEQADDKADVVLSDSSSDFEFF
jgi:hypothetical protein